MKSKGTKVVNLTNVKTNLYVRKELDQEWALQLGQIIEAHAKKKGSDPLFGMRDPMEVTDNGDGTYEMVNGRHRKWAYELNGVEEVKVKILEFDNAVEAIAYAFIANKGSKPPTSADIEHTIEEMDKIGVSLKKVAEMLELPAEMVQVAMDKVRAENKRRALCKAEELVLDQGKKLADAAQETGVKLEALRAFMGRHKKHRGKVKDTQRELTSLFRSHAQKLNRVFARLTKQYEVGDLSKSQVEKVIDKMEALNKQAVKALSDRRERFRVKANDQARGEKEAGRISA